MNREYEDILKTVTFYCPQCKERLSLNSHFLFSCGCGLRWNIPNPICVDNPILKPIKEVNGKVVK